MSTQQIDLGQFNIDNTDRIEVTVLKDEAPWDLTSGSVSFTFRAPDRSTQFVREATPSNAPLGVFYYDTTISDFTVTGDWTMAVKVVDGPVIKTYPFEIGFSVVDEPY